MSINKINDKTFFGNDADKFAIAKPGTVFYALDTKLTYVYGLDNQPVIFEGVASTAPIVGYTVDTLPAGSQGDKAYVTDATTPTFLGSLVGGGAVVTPVFHNGTEWVSA